MLRLVVSQAQTIEPRGWYLAGDVGRLVGVSGNLVGQWARYRYITASQSNANPKVYSFQDVAEAMVVHELLDHHFPYSEIRRTIDNTRVEFGDWPLLGAKIKVSEIGGPHRKGRILEGIDNDHLRDISHGKGAQMWLLTRDKMVSVVDDLRRGGWVIRKHPEIKHVEVDPDRLSGQPTIRDRRVPVDTVAAIGQRPGGFQILRADYDLNPAQIRDAIAWHNATAEYERAA
jgi:uncharacterized protein (DUF433 family)/DNA-binding transcriptional MerR regulator